MGESKYRIKEYEEYTHEYKRDDNMHIVMEVAGTRKAYYPQIYCGWWSGWVGLAEYPYYTKEEAITKIENHKLKMAIQKDNKVNYTYID